MSAATGLGADSAGVQCAAEGVKIVAGGASATIVHRQCVRVGTALAVERRSVEAKSDTADVTSILTEAGLYHKSADVRLYLKERELLERPRTVEGNGAGRKGLSLSSMSTSNMFRSYSGTGEAWDSGLT
jgi:hypothetical protein